MDSQLRERFAAGEVEFLQNGVALFHGPRSLRGEQSRRAQENRERLSHAADCITGFPRCEAQIAQASILGNS
jgi:hypothetical protein